MRKNFEKETNRNLGNGPDVGHACVPARRRLRQEDSQTEFEESLDDMASLCHTHKTQKTTTATKVIR